MHNNEDFTRAVMLIQEIESEMDKRQTKGRRATDNAKVLRLERMILVLLIVNLIAIVITINH